MNINLSGVQTSSLFQNAHISNQNTSKQNSTSKQQQVKQDRISISGKGKASNIINGLQKQKQALMQRKSEIRAKALEEGKSAQEVNTLLETYDMQIKNIDTQIAKIQTEETEKTTKPKEYNKNTPKTKQEAEKQKISSLTELSVHSEQADAINSVKNSVDRETRTLKSEIAMDKSYGIEQDYIEKKEEKLSELELKSQELAEDIGGKLGEVQQIAEKNNKASVNAVEEKDEKTTVEQIQQQQSEKAEETEKE